MRYESASILGQESQLATSVDRSLEGLLEEEEEHSVSSILAKIFGRNSLPIHSNNGNIRKQYVPQRSSYQSLPQVYFPRHKYRILPQKLHLAYIFPYIFPNYVNNVYTSQVRSSKQSMLTGR